MSQKTLTPSELRAWRSFLHAATRVLGQLEDEMKADAGERMATFDVLSNLAEAPDNTLRMSDLAEQALFSRSRLTYTVDNLEQRGLVVRRPDRDDGRGVVATLTPSGKRLHARLAAIHLEGVRRHFLDPLAAKEAAQLAASLEKVLTHLGARVEPPL